MISEEVEALIFDVKKALIKSKETWLKKKGKKLLSNIEKFNKEIKELEVDIDDIFGTLKDFTKKLIVFEKVMVDFVEEFTVFFNLTENIITLSFVAAKDENVRDELEALFDMAKDSYFRLKYYGKVVLKYYNLLSLPLDKKKLKRISYINLRLKRAIKDLDKASGYLGEFGKIRDLYKKVYGISSSISKVESEILKIHKDVEKKLRKRMERFLKIYDVFVRNNKPIKILKEVKENIGTLEKEWMKENFEKMRRFEKKIFVIQYSILNELYKLTKRLNGILGVLAKSSRDILRVYRISIKVEKYLKLSIELLADVYFYVKERRKELGIIIELDFGDLLPKIERMYKEFLGFLNLIGYLNSLIENLNEKNYEEITTSMNNLLLSFRSYRMDIKIKEYSEILKVLKAMLSDLLLSIADEIVRVIDEDIERLGLNVKLLRMEYKMAKRMRKMEYFEERLKSFIKLIENIEKVEVQEEKLYDLESFYIEMINRYKKEIEDLKTLKKEVLVVFKKRNRIYRRAPISSIVSSLNNVVKSLKSIAVSLNNLYLKVNAVIKRRRGWERIGKIEIKFDIDINSFRRDAYKLLKYYKIVEEEILKELDLGKYNKFLERTLKEKEEELKRFIVSSIRFLYGLKSKQR